MSDTDARIAALTAQLKDSEEQIKKLEEIARAQSKQIDGIRKQDAKEGGRRTGRPRASQPLCSIESTRSRQDKKGNTQLRGGGRGRTAAEPGGCAAR